VSESQQELSAADEFDYFHLRALAHKSGLPIALANDRFIEFDRNAFGGNVESG
jgi:hypothetical protein